jgi:hypothetical protein
MADGIPIPQAWTQFTEQPDVETERGTRFLWRKFADWAATDDGELASVEQIDDAVLRRYERSLARDDMSPRAFTAHLAAVHTVIDALQAGETTSAAATALRPPTAPAGALTDAEKLAAITALLASGSDLSEREHAIQRILKQ